MTTWTNSLTITLGNPTKKSDMDAAFNNTLFMQTKGTDIASGSTTDIGAATGLFVDVTGTATITALGTIAAGTLRIVRFTGALTLTHNATSLNLPTSANITTEAGDCAIFESLGSGNWKCINYMRQSGKTVSGTISQAELKTASGSVSVSASGENLALPGGEYGFYPQIKVTTGGSSNNVAYLVGAGYQQETYTTCIYLAPTADTMYAQQRYISASGKDHWIYLLQDKETGNILASYEAPDHPSANSQALYTDNPHPFASYKSDKHEIILADNDILKKIRGSINRKRGILDIIHQSCIIDDAKSVEYDYRLIRKINEYPDDPFGGEVISTFKTPQWAKIMIRAEVTTIEQFEINKLPEIINYRKLYFDEKRLK